MDPNLGKSPSREQRRPHESAARATPSQAAHWRPTLWASLRHPCAQIRAFAALQAEIAAGHGRWRSVPYRLWGTLSAIALGGSLLFGAALGVSFPAWRAGRGAAWLALSAGLSWLLFGPLLVRVTRHGLLTCAHACLVTMAYGEMVLVPGAALLWLRASWPGLFPLPPAIWGVGLVGVSNLVMAALFAVQMSALQVPLRRSLACWLVALDGSGALLFALFARLLQG
ncbi:MAG TPA: hypothetical protein VFU88_09095 [Ktedonobacterales bacterium]|nr:hypothetical protein [Ktedonobacterales bacterium]